MKPKPVNKVVRKVPVQSTKNKPKQRDANRFATLINNILDTHK